MTKLGILQTDLANAQDALTALQDELPQFHALLTENEQDAQRLKSERASLDAQAQAKGRVNVAREMLEQHQADLATARAEVARLEGAFAHETRLERMSHAAREADAHRAALDEAVTRAALTLQNAAASIAQEWTAYETSRAEFFALGGDVLGFPAWVGGVASNGLHGAEATELKESTQHMLAVLKERGAPLDALLEGEAVASEYRTVRGLPDTGLSPYVFAAVFDELPHSLKRTIAQRKSFTAVLPAVDAHGRRRF